jgi:hypothetical protein
MTTRACRALLAWFTHRATAIAIALLVPTAAALPDALAKKASAKIGFSVPDLAVDKLIDTVAAPADDVGIPTELIKVANAVWAGALVLILMFIVFGCVRLASGARGAGERLALVFGGTILLIAAVGVFQ